MELKQLHEEMLRTHNEFKTTVERELSEIKTKGVAHPDTTAALEKMNNRMSELQKHMDALAVKMERPPANGDSDKMSPEVKEYKEALVSYLRKGKMDNLETLHTKAMSVNSDPNGGYLVTPDSSGQIVQKIFESTPWRRYCAVQTISTDALEGMEDRDEVSTGWVSEIGTRSETDTPEIGKWRIEVHEMYAEPRVTQKLLDDAAVDVEAWLNGKVSDKFARVQNDVFVNGNGVGKPRGFTTYTTAATADSSRAWGVLEHVATGNNGDFASTNPADKVFDLVYAMKAAYRNGAAFAAPRAVVAKMRKFKGTTNYDYLWQPSIQEGQPARLMGFPIIESEDMPALATDSLSLAFGNLKRAYQIVDRQGIRVLRDNLTAKPYVKFYTTSRVGGAVVDFEALKLMKFGS